MDRHHLSETRALHISSSQRRLKKLAVAMTELLQAVLNSDEKADLRQLISKLRSREERYFLRNQILQAFADYCTSHHKPAYFHRTSFLGELLSYTHEMILEEKSVWLLVRPRIASQEIYRLSADLTNVEPMPVTELLKLHDRWVSHLSSNRGELLEIDMEPFYAGVPTIGDPRNIGKGLEFLNRHLSSQFAEPQQWLEALFEFLCRARYNHRRLLLNERIDSATDLPQRVKQALNVVGKLPAGAAYEQFRFELQELGFEPGWGNRADRVREMLELLDRLIEAPDHAVLEAFIGRIPLNFRVVLVSVHGWVAQEGVLGRQETAGQVAYVLDQALSLDHKLHEDVKLAGLDVLGIEPKVIILTRLIPNCEGSWCNQRLEKLQGTHNAWILRVPFEEFNPKVTQNWISKFEIWPYLETFALDAQNELLAEFQGNPDLVIGNYSDGNLVAFLLAKRLQAIHCNIAHTFEKQKYLFSHLYWQDLEPEYHFSLQFIADLIGMNAADFILTSTYQEIVGTPERAGYYESYKYFTMPGLYHVVNGIELFSPKFNVVPPGVNESLFFPYQHSDRVPEEGERIRELLFSRKDPDIVGSLDNISKRPIFLIAPLTAVKNLGGLVECFGRSEALQEKCNLILVTSRVRAQATDSPEQKREIEKLDQMIEQYHLQGKMRWLGLRLSTPDTAEAYRIIADCRGVFVHPALFEAFGLTILEAMISGLPTFATQFGGPSEIIQDGENGFHINPTDLEGTAQKISQFIAKCDRSPDYWTEISERAIKRVRNHYNWRSHTKQLLLLTKIYGFWTAQDNRRALQRYLEALFYLIYKPRAQQLLQEHQQR